jgi:hypothetical protein
MAETKPPTSQHGDPSTWEKPKPKGSESPRERPPKPSPSSLATKPARGRAWNQYVDPPAERVSHCGMCGSSEGVDLDTGWRCTRCGAYYPDPFGATL